MRHYAVITMLFFGASLISAASAEDSGSKADALDRRTATSMIAAPADNVLDDARLLDAPSRAVLVGLAKRAKEQADVDLYFAAYTILPGDIDEHARKLRLAWAGGDRGLVMVYRRGSQQLTFSANSETDNFIPTSELYAIYSESVAAALARETPRERILAAATNLAEGVIRDLDVRDPKRGMFTADVLKLLAGLLLALSIIAAVSFAIVRRLSRRRADRETAIAFPEVVVGMRLGASFGGGVVADIEFGKAAIPQAEAGPVAGL